MYCLSYKQMITKVCLEKVYLSRPRYWNFPVLVNTDYWNIFGVPVRGGGGT